MEQPMRSSELASLAGVTVRTLRHYHQVGVLPEPSRAVNGYREYGVHHLIRVLRIRRVAALGVPLERVGEVLDAPDQAHPSLLDELEGAVDEEIRRLESQKSMIRMLRASDAHPDLDPALAPFVTLLLGSAVNSPSLQWDREYSILLGHLAGDDGVERLGQVYARLAATAPDGRADDIRQAFDALGAEAGDQEIEEFVDAMVTTLGDTVAELRPLMVGLFHDETLVDQLVDGYIADTVNRAQRDALSRLVTRLGTA
jgi:DNA-binding transcriptional MerR regulator